jgi:hypothetical protein
VFMSQPFTQLHMGNALVWEAARLASSSADPIYRRTLGWDSLISRAISCERLSFRSGNYGFSSTGAHTLHGRSALASAAGFYTSCLTENLVQYSKYLSVWKTSARIT